MTELGKWIKERFGSQLAFAKEFGTTQGQVSKWVAGTESISAANQARIRGLKYKGAWPREEAQDAAAGGPAPYVTREEFEDVPGRLRRLEEDIRALLPLVQAVKDLDARVRKLAGDSGSVE